MEEPHARRGHLAVVALDAHVGPCKESRREGHERRQGHEEYVERVDEELLVQNEDRTVGNDLHREHGRGDEGGQAERDVDFRGRFLMPDQAKYSCADERNAEDREQGFHHSSFRRSRWRMSRLSNCSRIWNMNTPRMISATSTSSAMPSSTTIGMP